jgi:hypothetical protein
MIVAVVVVESYVHTINRQGKRYLLPEDRDEALPRLLKGYGAYLSGVLAFWFLRPLARPKSDAADKSRFWIAMICTSFFNAAILFLLLECYFEPLGSCNFPADVDTVMGLMKWLAFVIAPVNAFYFGAKTSR